MWLTYRSTVCGAAVIILMTLIAYGPAVQSGFIWDDDAYVTRNPLLTDSDGLKRIWFSDDSPSQYFPLVYTVFRIEHALFDDGPLYFNGYHYHLTNVILHIINALLLWLILRRLRIPGAWLAAAIFALHPVHVESVAWITELKNVLSTFFMLLAILAWMRFVDKRSLPVRDAWVYYALALVCGLMALFAKTTACVLPAILLIVVWLRGERLQRKHIVQVVPFVIIALAMALLTIWWERHIQGTTGDQFSFTPMQRILLASHAIWFYAGKLVWPMDLSFSYTRWTLDVHDPAQYAWIAVCLGTAAVLWFGRKRLGRGVLAAACFYPIVLAPMLGFVSLYTFRYSFVADHYQYVASIGLIALFSALLVRLSSQIKDAFGVRGLLAVRVLQSVFIPALLITLMILTRAQTRIYQDAETIWTDTVKKNPTSPFAHYNLGVELSARGSMDRAMEEYLIAIRLEPTKGEAHSNLGAILRARGDEDGALREYNLAIKYSPELPEPHHNVAIILYNRGRYEDAWREVRLCRKLGATPHPDFIRALSEKMPEPPPHP